jgi:hypothetical protein
MSTKYTVNIEKFAKRHYIKSFSKKYGRAWDITLETLIREFQSFDVLIENKIADIIVGSETVKICKFDFRVAGTNESRRGSGNRCIVALHKDKNAVVVLLVYGKTDIGGGKETATWKNIIRENYLEYRDLL